jgi:rifampicin phosphotransferase
MRRRGEQAWVRAHPGPTVVGPTGPMPSLRFLPKHGRHINQAMFWALTMEFPGVVPVSDGHELGGMPASPGRYTGRVRIVSGESDFATFLPGEVLVCPNRLSGQLPVPIGDHWPRTRFVSGCTFRVSRATS